jgi:P pilus assembly chaperone PapD
MSKNLNSMLAIVSVLMCQSLHASVVVDGTRVIFDGSKKEATVFVDNKDSITNLVQSWLEPADQNTPADALVVTPPLFRLGAGERNVIHFLPSGKALSETTESMYWLNVKGIPASTQENQNNQIQLAINTRIKLIYRPSALNKGNPTDFADKITWEKVGDKKVMVKNPTPYYMNFYEVKIDNVAINAITFIPPHGSVTVDMKTNAFHVAEWSIINDFGVKGISHTYKAG